MNNMQAAIITLKHWHRQNSKGNPIAYGPHAIQFEESVRAICEELDIEALHNDLYNGGPNRFVLIEEGDTFSDMIEQLEIECSVDSFNAVKDANPQLTSGDVGSISNLGKAELLVNASNAGAASPTVGIHAATLHAIILNDLKLAISMGISNIQLA